MRRSTFLKLCSIILALTLCLASFAGCGEGGTTADTSSKNRRPVSSNTASADESTPDESSSEDLASSDTDDFYYSNNNNNNANGGGTTAPAASTVTVTTTETKAAPFDASKNPLQRGVNLSLFEGDNEVGYDNWIFDNSIYDAIREKGFDHVRLPVDFFKHMEGAPNYKINEEFLRKIDTAINTALSAGLKIVLDFHHMGVLQVNVKGNQQQYFSMWEQLSVHYKNYPSGLIFELFNEPGNASALAKPTAERDQLTSEKIIMLCDEAMKIIRKTNPTRIIVHPTSWNNGWLQLNRTEPLLPEGDKNIIMAVHSYEPMSFTHQGANWDGGAGRPGGVMLEDALNENYSGASTEEDNLRNAFATIKRYQEETGRPVWIGEFGALGSSAPAGERAKYANLLIDLMKDAGCGWCWWEFESGFGVYSTGTKTWKDDGVVDALLK